MVFGIAHLLGGTGSEPAGDAARVVGAAGRRRPSSSTALSTADAEPRAGQRRSATSRRPRRPRPRSPEPSGACVASDIVATPKVKGAAYAGSRVTFRLKLTTLESPACTWRVSPSSLAVKLVSGSDRIWSSQDCPASIPSTDVVVRKEHPAKVDVSWRGQRSDSTCSRDHALGAARLVPRPGGGLRRRAGRRAVRAAPARAGDDHAQAEARAEEEVGPEVRSRPRRSRATTAHPTGRRAEPPSRAPATIAAKVHTLHGQVRSWASHPAHNVGVADSYAHRTADRVFVQMHLPGLVDASGSVGVRLVSLGKGDQAARGRRGRGASGRPRGAAHRLGPAGRGRAGSLAGPAAEG